MPPLYTNLYDWTTRCYWFKSKNSYQSEWIYVNYPSVIAKRPEKIRHLIWAPSISVPLLFIYCM